MLRALTVLVLVAVALAATGCGDSDSDSAKDFDGPKRAVAVAVEDLQQAGEDDEPATICEDLLAASLLQRLRQAGTNCRTAVSEALDDADNFTLDVDDVRIAGRTATARVTSGSGDQEKTDTLRLEREGRVWKIASLGATR